jgi:hypothetical protein
LASVGRDEALVEDAMKKQRPKRVIWMELVPRRATAAASETIRRSIGLKLEVTPEREISDEVEFDPLTARVKSGKKLVRPSSHRGKLAEAVALK